ncbi:MAG: hypothetical protein RSB71_00505 [Bacilli bacterium]
MKKEVELLNLQILASFLFIISVIISIIIVYDEKQEILKQPTIFSKEFDKYLNLFNRILVVLLALTFLYINCQSYKKATTSLLEQVIASLLTVVASFIILNVVIKRWNDEGISAVLNL